MMLYSKATFHLTPGCDIKNFMIDYTSGEEVVFRTRHLIRYLSIEYAPAFPCLDFYEFPASMILWKLCWPQSDRLPSHDQVLQSYIRSCKHPDLAWIIATHMASQVEILTLLAKMSHRLAV